MATLVNVDGMLGSEEDRLLSPLDQGFLFGASVYETVRTYGGRTFLLERHLGRLRESAKALDIALDVTDDELAALARMSIEGSVAPAALSKTLLDGVDDWLAQPTEAASETPTPPSVPAP